MNETEQPEFHPNEDASSADQGDSPWIEARPGRVVSAAGLLERIISQYLEEFGDETFSGDTLEQRRLLRDVAEYVLGIEGIRLSPDEHARILQRAFSELFAYGPLDACFADESMTTLAIEGEDKIAVRYRPGEDLVVMEPIFEDAAHVRRILSRMIVRAGAEVQPDLPVIETGLMIAGRRISINLALPPFTPVWTADIRLHPLQLPSLEDWIEADILTKIATQLLRAIAKSPHGFVIVGDTESGKTTLLSMLLHELDSADGVIAVERASELFLPEGARSHPVLWPQDDTPGRSFGGQILAALAEEDIRTIVLDEVRADESDAVAPLLSGDAGIRQIWSFRGSADPKRLRSALGMLARMADRSQSEVMALEMYTRLPFVITMRRRKGRLQLVSVAEWQHRPDAEYPDFVELMALEWEGIALTGRTANRSLGLADSFWGS